MPPLFFRLGRALDPQHLAALPRQTAPDQVRAPAVRVLPHEVQTPPALGENRGRGRCSAPAERIRDLRAGVPHPDPHPVPPRPAQPERVRARGVPVRVGDQFARQQFGGVDEIPHPVHRQHGPRVARAIPGPRGSCGSCKVYAQGGVTVARAMEVSVHGGSVGMCVSHGPVTRPLRRAGYFRAGGLGSETSTPAKDYLHRSHVILGRTTRVSDAHNAADPKESSRMAGQAQHRLRAGYAAGRGTTQAARARRAHRHAGRRPSRHERGAAQQHRGGRFGVQRGTGASRPALLAARTRPSSRRSLRHDRRTQARLVGGVPGDPARSPSGPRRDRAPRHKTAGRAPAATSRASCRPRPRARDLPAGSA